MGEVELELKEEVMEQITERLIIASPHQVKCMRAMDFQEFP
jgi:hypothetical protein